MEGRKRDLYYITAVIAAGYAVLIWKAWRRDWTKEGIPSDGSKCMYPFYRCGNLIFARLESFLPHEGGRIRKQLMKLYPNEDVRCLVKKYYVQKMALMLVILLVGTVLGTLTSLQSSSEALLTEEGQVRRGRFEQGSRRLTLKAFVEGMAQQIFQIEVQGQIPDYEEADRLEAEFWSRASNAVLGENPSLQEVLGDLELVESLEGYPFVVTWESSRPDLIDSYGWVRPLEEGKEEVRLWAKVTYGDWEWDHELRVTVTSSPGQTMEEALYEELEELLRDSEERSREESVWVLPDEWEGKDVLWEEVREDNGVLLWIAGLGTAMAVFFLRDKDLNAKLREREQKLKEAYPEIVNKLLLYLGAGLNVRSAFYRVAEERQRKEAGKKTEPAYEELLYTCRELQAGISEGLAYERLGKRIGLQEYVRLGALLSQNLKKGNGALFERLREEAECSRREQINRFRRSGEEISTKLLVPMVMMLGIIMVMIMIPAFGTL